MSDILRTPMIQRLVARAEEACLAIVKIPSLLERVAVALEAQNAATDPPENPYDRVVLGLLRREAGIKWSTGAIQNKIRVANPDFDKEALGLSLRDLEIRGVIHYDDGWFVYQEATDQEEP